MPDENEEQLPEHEEYKPDFEYIPGRHTWRQQGYYLVCNSCLLQHAIFIGKDKLMVGEKEDGTPILKMRK
jgi:hypothetical protein